VHAKSLQFCPGDLPDPRIKRASLVLPALQTGSLLLVPPGKLPTFVEVKLNKALKIQSKVLDL
jgi:hypothetical protein